MSIKPNLLPVKRLFTRFHTGISTSFGLDFAGCVLTGARHEKMSKYALNRSGKAALVTGISSH